MATYVQAYTYKSEVRVSSCIEQQTISSLSEAEGQKRREFFSEHKFIPPNLPCLERKPDLTISSLCYEPRAQAESVIQFQVDNDQEGI